MNKNITPIYGLAPLKNRFIGGDFWDSEPQLVAAIKAPDGEQYAVPVTGFSAPKQLDEVFASNDVSTHTFGRLGGVLSATIRVPVPDKEQSQRSDTVSLIEREDGVYAVYKRYEGEPGYDILYDLADDSNRGRLPTDKETPLDRVFEVHESGEVTVEHESVETPDGEIIQKPVQKEPERQTTYFLAEVRLFSVGGSREGDNEGIAAQALETIKEQFDLVIPTEDGHLPSLEYINGSKECECRKYKKNEISMCGTIIERRDKYEVRRCPDCGRSFIRRNGQEIAHEPHPEY